MIKDRYCTYIWSTHDRRKAHPALTSDLLVRKARPALTSDHVGTNPIIISERPSTYIWSTRDRRKALHLHLINTWSKKGTTLISDQHMIEERLSTYIWSTHDWRKALHLHPPRKEHILLIMMEGLALISDLVGTNPTVISEWPPVLLDWPTW